MTEQDLAILIGLAAAAMLALFMWVTWTDRIPKTWGEFFTRKGWRRKR